MPQPQYTQLDLDVADRAGNVFYYQVRRTGQSGQITNSNVVELIRREPAEMEYLSLYPNPVQLGRNLIQAAIVAQQGERGTRLYPAED